MTLLYHNHDFEFAKKDGEYLLDIMYRDIPASLLQTEQDTCWVKASGVDPAAYIRKYSGRRPSCISKISTNPEMPVFPTS